MKIVLSSQSSWKDLRGPQRSLDHTLKTTALEQLCTCELGDMYKNSFILQSIYFVPGIMNV